MAQIFPAIDWQAPIESIDGVRLRFCVGEDRPDGDGDYCLEPSYEGSNAQSPHDMGWPIIVRPDGRHWALLDDGPVVRNRGRDDLQARERVGALEWRPGRQLIRSLRSYQRRGRIGRALAILRHRFWSVICGADIPVNSSIGDGLLIPHPQGIVIHPEARVGERCLIFQQVTIGTLEGRRGAPVIGAHVDIGAGAKILGPVVIGDGARIGANAVVLNDVPADSVAVGIPARIQARRAG